MKLLQQLVWTSILTSVSASFEAYIYLSDSEQKPDSNPPLLSPDTARLLLAQRLGLAEYHELGSITDSELGVLNGYGGKQKALFAPKEQADGKLLILEGIEHPSGTPARETAVITVCLTYCQILSA